MSVTAMVSAGPPSAYCFSAPSSKRGDKRPVWVLGLDGSNPHVVEPLHYQTTIDKSTLLLSLELVAADRFSME